MIKKIILGITVFGLAAGMFTSGIYLKRSEHAFTALTSMYSHQWERAEKFEEAYGQMKELFEIQLGETEKANAEIDKANAEVKAMWSKMHDAVMAMPNNGDRKKLKNILEGAYDHKY